MKFTDKVHKLGIAALLLTLVGVIAACSGRDEFTQGAITQTFIQDYNPEFLDVLWMIDDRTSVAFQSGVRARLVSEASKFFARLDKATTSDYRMAFVSHDLEYSQPGELKPRGNPVILIKNYGDVASRTQQFASIIGLPVNLFTGATNQGFESVRLALNRTFQPRAGVPLVIVFISDSDDASSPASGDAVDFYANAYLSLKGNNRDQLRVYSVNYVSGGERCAKADRPDIDRAGFQDRYFRLARNLGGATADLCGSFADQIDLTGLRQKELPRRFKLDLPPRDGAVKVSVFSESQRYDDLKFTFDAATNEVVFEQAPPAGTSILVTYNH